MVRVGEQFLYQGRDASTMKKASVKAIYEMLRPYLSCGLAKRASGLLEMLEAGGLPLIFRYTRIGSMSPTARCSSMECLQRRKNSAANRLPVKYEQCAAACEMAAFLSELLEDEDILTLQEYLGYCLIPTNRGQTHDAAPKATAAESKSRIGVVMQKMLGDNLKMAVSPKQSAVPLPEPIWSISWSR